MSTPRNVDKEARYLAAREAEIAANVAAEKARRDADRANTSTRIARVIWTVPGVAEGEKPTLRAAEAEIANARSRVGPLYAFVVICRADDSRERRDA
jgi:hypothetical protein